MAIAGDNDIRTPTVAQQKRNICRVKMHPEFNSRILDHDIALLKLCQPMTLNEKVKTIKMGKTQNVDQVVTTAGWGKVIYKGNQTQHLMAVNLPIVENPTCQHSYRSYQAFNVRPWHICAGEGGKDACTGDSGGPLWITDEDPTLIGVVSFGQGCANPDYPGVYARISYYRDWIMANVPELCNKTRCKYYAADESISFETYWHKLNLLWSKKRDWLMS